ncbi:bis(5'-nucleosyl)-tetraphosphatase (symmetrical) YqeK [Anaerovorax sp. IOR16]|uniref:bis(5'-nucleosyl)-tetraphosphatase (symmetrical) YqeK n=1 Tax=Anaerovorax sp. IOR16 TaxID=2773458 RepID=UPI001FD68E8A|nr:bis(5'-nucleosyl)-tetraphosphatase (symmetrical) YqeK [Anaerovorax sp. IOR16]
MYTKNGIKKEITSYIQANLKEKRLAHTFGVVEEAKKLAKKYGVNPIKAELGALFHDAFRERGNLIHGNIAADVMKDTYQIKDEDLCNAVRFHTTGRAGMSLLEKILYMADAIEPNRSYPGVDELRILAYKDLDAACLQAFRNTIRYVTENGLDLDYNTLEAYKDIKKGDYMENKEIALSAAAVLDQKKAIDIVVMDIKEKSSFADFFVIASANSERQLSTLADEVEDQFAKDGILAKHIEGRGNSGWILMDFGDVIVNLFSLEQRERYNIEKVWGDCEIIPFDATEN